MPIAEISGHFAKSIRKGVTMKMDFIKYFRSSKCCCVVR
jgi:hypothetical protein